VERSELSRITKPLLAPKQVNVELMLDYKNGEIKRNSPWHAPVRYYNYYQTLNPHVTPALNVRYGIRDDLQVEAGFAFITPYKYKYDYRRENADTTTIKMPATYKLSNQFEIPLRAYYRPLQNMQIMFSSDIKMGNQKLDYHQKNTDNSITNYDSRELSYYLAQPSVRLLYLIDPNAEVGEDTFAAVTKDLLTRNQVLLEVFFKRDIAHLDKQNNNGAQNIIDPYNAFEYPQDYFVAGTENALFWTGNYTGLATNTELHNYFVLEGGATYGVLDNVNTSAKIGYHSGAQFHHFVVNELQDRYYNVKPHYYFDFGADWRVTRNSMISINSHLVPDYETFMTREHDTKSFHQKTMYFDIAIAWKILFG